MKHYTSPTYVVEQLNDTDIIVSSMTNINGNGDLGLGGSGSGIVRTPSRIWD